MGPFDVLQTIFGRPPAEAQLAAALGQGPGQPGSPQGPQPLAGQNAPPVGPAGPGGSPDPSGGPAAPQQQQQQQAPPQPQAYTSPPDLAQAYLALSQQNQAREGFWSGLSGVAAALHPGRVTPAMMKAIAGPQGQDAGSLFSNLVQLQQYQQQNQALQAYRQNVPGMLKGMGLTDDEIKAYTPLALADPSFATKIAENKLGVGGGPAWMAQMHAEKALRDSGQPIPWTPGDPSSYNAWNTANTASNVGHAKEMQDFKDSGVEDLATVEPRFDKGEKTVDTLLGNMDATMTALQAPGFLTRGPVPGYLGGGPYNQDVKDAAAAMATLQAQLAGEGLKNTKNVRNVREFNALKESMTAALDPSNSPAQVQQALQDIKSGIARAHAQALAVAGKQVPYAYKGLADQRYFTKGDPYYTGATQEEAPADNGGGGGALKPMPDATKSAAQALIAKDPSQRGPLIQHLREQGIDPSGL